MRFAKFINKYQIKFPPLSTESVSNYHLATQKLLADGYKQTEPPHPPMLNLLIVYMNFSFVV